MDFIHANVWVPMSEPEDVGAGRVTLLSSQQVSAVLMNSTDGPQFKFMYCLPVFHHPDTTVDHEIMEHTGMCTGLEVTDEVFESAASIVFDQAGTRLHTIKAILVETLGK